MAREGESGQQSVRVADESCTAGGVLQVGYEGLAMEAGEWDE